LIALCKQLNSTRTEVEQITPSWWKRLLIGALVGSFSGALNIWFYEFSLIRLVAAILAGASFFAIVSLLAVKFKEDEFKVAALGGLAGLAAGGVYWIVGHPPSSALFAMGIGFVGGIVYAWAES